MKEIEHEVGHVQCTADMALEIALDDVPCGVDEGGYGCHKASGMAEVYGSEVTIGWLTRQSEPTGALATFLVPD